MRNLDPLLVALARDQGGWFTVPQAARLETSKHTVVALLRDGILRRAARGLYAVTDMIGECSPVEWHRHCARGAGVLYPDARLAGGTAVIAHGLPTFSMNLDEVVLARPIRRSYRTGCYWVRPHAFASEVDTELGLSVSVEDAITQFAIDSRGTQAVPSADAAINAGRTSLDALTASVDRVRHWPRSHRARSMLAFTDGRRESVGESRAGIWMAAHGIAVTPQAEIRDRARFVARVDFLIDGTKVIVEFDGKIKYADGDPSVLWAEKRREDELRRLGYCVVRVTWADFERPGVLITKIRTAMNLAS